MLSALWREFQSTLPYGSDSLTWAKALQSPIFQSTLPRGSDGKINIIDFLKTYFNPRSLAGATMFLMIRVPQDNQNFNPRSLAGATTGAYCSIPYVTAISIHAPSRERRSIRLFLGRNTDFNPRSLAGATFQIMVNQPSTPISIHAPSRERPGYNLFRSPTLEFQSTLPRGSDLGLYLRSKKNEKFQSTLPRGSDATLDSCAL